MYFFVLKSDIHIDDETTKYLSPSASIYVSLSQHTDFGFGL